MSLTASGMTHTCINQAANILAKQGVLVAGNKVVADGFWIWPPKRTDTEEHQSDFQRVPAKPGDEAGTGCLRENISMTITLQAVNELIQSLESAGRAVDQNPEVLRAGERVSHLQPLLDATIKTEYAGRPKCSTGCGEYVNQSYERLSIRRNCVVMSLMALLRGRRCICCGGR